MSLERFIARRLVFSQDPEFRVAKPVMRLATWGVILGCSVMVLTVCIVGGFQQEIRQKLIGFNSHIQVSRFDRNFSYETTPVVMTEDSIRLLSRLPGVAHVQRFATKAGILTRQGQLQGIVAKGIGSDYDWSFFSRHLKSGRLINLPREGKSSEIILSTRVARKLAISVGDSLVMHFIQQPPRARKFVVTGLYETGMEEFDKLYLFCDIRQIQQLNDWTQGEIGGLEIRADDFQRLDQTTEAVYQSIGSDLNARSIRELYPQIFDWLNLQDINAIIIITLMVIVAGINMISALLVLMLERVTLIGVLKALGAGDRSLRRIFLWVAGFTIGRGLVWGNLIGLGLAALQYFFHVIPLDQTSYYIDFVPIRFDPELLLFLNAGTLILSLGMMLLPALLIGRIRVVNALRFG